MIRLIIIHVLYHDDNDITNNCHAIPLKMSTLWININVIDICSPFMKLGILYDLHEFQIWPKHTEVKTAIYSCIKFFKRILYKTWLYIQILLVEECRIEAKAKEQFSMPDLKPYLMYDKELSSSIYRGVNRGIHTHREERNEEMLQMLFHTRDLPIAMNAMISWAFCSWWWWW